MGEPASPRPLPELAADLLTARWRVEHLQLELLGRLEAADADDTRRIEVPGLGKIAYVGPAESTSIDGRACARKLAGLGAAVRALRAELPKMAERVTQLRELPLVQLEEALEQLAADVGRLLDGAPDDEIPVTHSARKPTLRVTLAH